MGLLLSFYHLLNFVAPALMLATVLVLVGARGGARSGAMLPRWAQWLVVLLVGLLVLLAGLWWGGRDGRMMTYAALVVTTATCQWVQVRGWR